MLVNVIKSFFEAESLELVLIQIASKTELMTCNKNQIKRLIMKILFISPFVNCTAN